MKLSSNPAQQLRKVSRFLHRELSFLFAGMVLIYATSGIVMNHRNTINPNYSVEQRKVTVESLPAQQQVTKADVLRVLEPLDEAKSYTKHYFPQKDVMKVFLKGGSSLVVNLSTREAVYEKLTPRPVLSAITKLHYNPGHWWTAFADLFAGALILITFTGLIMLKGPKGLWGRGGIELIIGIAIPLIFLFC